MGSKKFICYPFCYPFRETNRQKKARFRGFFFSYQLLSKSSDGGEGGIRTHETLPRPLVFKTSAFNHSATSPAVWCGLYLVHAASKVKPAKNLFHSMNLFFSQRNQRAPPKPPIPLRKLVLTKISLSCGDILIGFS